MKKNDDNSGAIFKNTYKKTEQQPDYKGKAVIDGTEKEVALWLRESKNGQKYFYVKFSRPYVTEVEQGGPAEDERIKKAQQSDDLPF